MASDLIKKLRKLSQPEIRNEEDKQREISPASLPKPGLQGLRGYKPSNTLETLNISQAPIVAPGSSQGLQGLQSETADLQTEHFVAPVAPKEKLGLQWNQKNTHENQILNEFVARSPCSPEKTSGAGGISLSSPKLQPDTSAVTSPVSRPPSTGVPHKDTTRATVAKVPPSWVALTTRAVEAIAHEIAGLNLGSDAERETALRSRFGPSADLEEAQEDLAKVLDRAKAIGPSEAPDPAAATQAQPTTAQAAPTAPLAKRAQAELLAEMRAPDLQALVAQHGGYDKITPEAWIEFERATARHRERMIRGDFWLPPYKGLRAEAPAEAPAAAPPASWWSDPVTLNQLDAVGLADAAASSGYFLVLNEAGSDFHITVGGQRNPALDRALRNRHGELTRFLHDRDQGLHSLRHKCARIFAAWREAFGLKRIVDIDELATGSIPHELDLALLVLAAHDADRTALDNDKLKRALRAMAEIAAEGLCLKFEGVSETGADRWSLQTVGDFDE